MVHLPTVVVVDDPHHRLMEEEIFGPIAAIYTRRQPVERMLTEIDNTSPYALTGAVFSKDDMQ